ncbi:PREDICTED: ADP-ribosylation factor GTPase-activating protein AGD4 [Tarenaya hassleriana]|uniref:ADP-ribosylation factor GTPase-activating protein AGD4 n=1 Tax=Tarenaya hassleriana TaxID=28532 RepID=UPI00053CA6C9|nr:PREDICTED: ADP-ribosylation factor GTPase-activating protein AGD4 [Tarenaya hassleriana]
MAAFINLEDSPMFQKQVCSLEETADELKDRCQKLYKGVKKFMGALGEASTGDTAFADSLEAFGAGHDDPVSVSIGGPVISKFINILRELGSYKEFLRSQVEHVLLERLTNFLNVDLQEAKESRRRFDKAVHSYDQAREKFVSLKKNTRGDIVAELEEDLENSKSAFEKSRFNLVNSLMNIEAKKKYEFLESISAIMDAHLRYFKLGYDLLSQLEPFIHQVLTYAQQSKEQTKIEQDRLERRIQEFRTQSELDSQRASSNAEPSSADGNRVVGIMQYKNIEATLPSTADKEVIKQGYLLKRSSSIRGDWKRRFFVLDSHGSLFYYRNTGNRSTGTQYHYTGSSDHNSSVFGRFRSRHNRSASLADMSLGYTTIDLRTSMIKLDAEDTDLRLCFRIISPQKTYTLQAENGADRMDWVNKITAAIATLLNSHFLQQPLIRYLNKSYSGSGSAADILSLDSQQENDDKLNMADDVPTILRRIPGNNVCAECNAPVPDWASLNLGVLLCIECSGVHRNLGVHISKVRSLTLDVKVWEPTILELFRNLGNEFCNSVWEGLLLLDNDSDSKSTVTHASISKPCPEDSFSLKEKYIQGKYLERALVIKDAGDGNRSAACGIWEAVQSQNIREIYRLIVTSDTTIINTKFDDVTDTDSYHHLGNSSDEDSPAEKKGHDPSACRRIKDSKEPGNCLQGCTLLHVACHSGDAVMLELLLQFGADLNMRDFHGRTPLHHCIASGNNTFAKILLRRGGRPSIEDGGGLSVLERAMEMGAITDEELFILLAES